MWKNLNHASSQEVVAYRREVIQYLLVSHSRRNGRLPYLADRLSVTNSYPAGIYLYTSDSAFNQVQMARYMGTGTIIRPPKSQFGGFPTTSNSSSLGEPQTEEGYPTYEVVDSAPV